MREERVVHVPVAALLAGAERGLGRLLRVRVDREREALHDETDVALVGVDDPPDRRLRAAAELALVVGEFDDRHRRLRPAPRRAVGLHLDLRRQERRKQVLDLRLRPQLRDVASAPFLQVLAADEGRDLRLHLLERRDGAAVRLGLVVDGLEIRLGRLGDPARDLALEERFDGEALPLRGGLEEALLDQAVQRAGLRGVDFLRVAGLHLGQRAPGLGGQLRVGDDLPVDARDRSAAVLRAGARRAAGSDESGRERGRRREREDPGRRLPRVQGFPPGLSVGHETPELHEARVSKSKGRTRGPRRAGPPMGCP